MSNGEAYFSTCNAGSNEFSITNCNFPPSSPVVGDVGQYNYCKNCSQKCDEPPDFQYTQYIEDMNKFCMSSLSGDECPYSKEGRTDCTYMVANNQYGDLCRAWRNDPCMTLGTPDIRSKKLYSGTSCPITKVGETIMYTNDNGVDTWCNAHLNDPSCNCQNASKSGNNLHEQWSALNEIYGPNGLNLPEKCWWRWCRKDFAANDETRQYLKRNQLCQSTCCDTCEEPNTCTRPGSLWPAGSDSDPETQCCPALPPCSNIVVKSGTTGTINVSQIANCSGANDATYWTSGSLDGGTDYTKSENWPCHQIRQCDTLPWIKCPEGTPGRNEQGQCSTCPVGTPDLPDGNPQGPIEATNFFTMPHGGAGAGDWGPYIEGGGAGGYTGSVEWSCKCCQLNWPEGEEIVNNCPESGSWCSGDNRHYCDKDSYVCSSEPSLRSSGTPDVLKGQGAISWVTIAVIVLVLVVLKPRSTN